MILHLTFEFDKEQDHMDIALRVFLSKNTECWDTHQKPGVPNWKQVSKDGPGQKQRKMKSQNKQVSAYVINILGAYKTNQIKTQTNSPGKKADK